MYFLWKFMLVIFFSILIFFSTVRSISLYYIFCKLMFQVLKQKVPLMGPQIFIRGQLLEKINHPLLYQQNVLLVLSVIKLHYVWMFFVIENLVHVVVLVFPILVFGEWWVSINTTFYLSYEKLKIFIIFFTMFYIIRISRKGRNIK